MFISFWSTRMRSFRAWPEDPAAGSIKQREYQQGHHRAGGPRDQLELVGRTKKIRQRFYAISIERKIRHPAVVAICEAARRHIFT
jgi:hypothetical protein